MMSTLVKDRPALRPEADARHVSRFAALLRDARLLLVALWLGGAVFFAFVVAPSAFAVLPTRALAGAMVNRTLGVLNVAGAVVGALALIGAFLRNELISRRAFRVEVAALALLAVSSAIGQWVVAARLATLRAVMNRPIDDVAADDPLRLAFAAWHGYSMIALLVGIVAALVALLAVARRSR